MRAEVGRGDPSAPLEKCLHVAQSRRPGAEAPEKSRCPSFNSGRCTHPLGFLAKPGRKVQGKEGRHAEIAEEGLKKEYQNSL